MTISATQALSGVNALVSARVASLRDPSALTQKIPALATAPLAVTLGSTRAQPRLYDASGLIRGLINLDQGGQLPSTRQSGEAAAGLQADLETTLGLDSGSAGLAGSSRVALSANSVDALAAVLAKGTGAESGLESDLALQELLAQALGSFSAGLDRTRTAATAINASGVLQAASATDALRAANSLGADTLVLAAQALGTDRETAASLAIGTQIQANNDASTQAFNRLVAADLEQALAETDAARPRRRHSSTPETSDVLLAGFALPGSETDATALPEFTANPLDGVLPRPGLAADALARAGLRSLPLSTNPSDNTTQVPDATAQAESLASPTPAVALTQAPAALRNTADAGLARDSTATRTPPTVAANPVVVSATRPKEPRYAELAAAMTMGAAVYRYQTTVSITVPPGELPPHRTVRAILAVPESKSVD
jgi:hypothetical protein